MVRCQCRDRAVLVSIVMSLLVVTCAYSAPTAVVHDNTALVGTASVGDCTIAPVTSVSEMSPTADLPSPAEAGYAKAGAHNWNLAGVAAELLKPPTDLSAASTSHVQVTSLPAVPSAVFMVLTGFLCVSLVKDRKVWLAALAALLWAGQAGFSALPQLAHHIASRKQTEQFSPANLTCTPELIHSDRLRSDIEGTRYIGLLRHLAGIPDNRMSFLRKQESKSTNAHVRTPQFALTEVLADILSATNRLAYITKQHACFSPAFIFSNLARGPPRQTWKRFFLLCNFELQSVFANTLTKLRYICK